MNDDQLKDVLAKLRADYAEQLPRTVAQMELLWRRLIAAEGPPSGLAELLRMAHSIAGSGTTFGIPGASAAAGELEEVLGRFGTSGDWPGAQEQQTVATLLAALKQSAAQSQT